MPPPTEPVSAPNATVEGALLSATQIKWVKIAIAIMTTLLAIGIPLLIGRVIYLARQGGTQAPVASTAATIEPPLAAAQRLALASGAAVKSIALSGARLAVHTTAEGGREEIVILDLASGAVLSRVELTRGR